MSIAKEKQRLINEAEEGLSLAEYTEKLETLIRNDERERVIKRLSSYVRLTDYNWLLMNNHEIRFLFRQQL